MKIARVQRKETYSATDLLLDMSGLEHLRDLIKHPLVTSFLHLRWLRFRALFYVNVVFFAAFVLLLTAYVLALGEAEG